MLELKKSIDIYYNKNVTMEFSLNVFYLSLKIFYLP